MSILQSFLNLKESVIDNNSYRASDVSDREYAFAIEESAKEVGFALGAQGQIKGAISEAMITAMTEAKTDEEFNAIILREAFAPSGFLKKVLDFFVNLWRKLVQLVKGLIGNAFNSTSGYRKNLMNAKEIFNRCKSRKYKEASQIKFYNFDFDTAKKIGLQFINPAFYYGTSLKEGSSVTFDDVNVIVEDYGAAILGGDYDASTRDGAYKGEGATVKSNGLGQNEGVRKGASFNLETAKSYEKELELGEKGSVKILKTLMDATVKTAGSDKDKLEKVFKEVKESEKVGKYMTEIREQLFPVKDLNKLEKTVAGAGIPNLCTGMVATLEGKMGDVSLDSLTDILNKEVPAMTAKADRMERVAKQIENSKTSSKEALLSDKKGEGDTPGAFGTAPTQANKDSIVKDVTDIAQIAQKIGSAMSAAINEGIKVATNILMELVTEINKIAGMVDKLTPDND